MSYFYGPDPLCERERGTNHVALEIIPRTVDLGGFDVRRVLPSKDKRMVGPFVFWDQAGPGEFLTGQGLDVRPHPHICLSTMTYLFAGSLEHRDTLGSHQIILPGAVNLMTAGRGIAHSERTPQSERQHSHQLFGLQCWLALPISKEEMEPSFTHYPQTCIPVTDGEGVRLSVAAGKLEGLASPVITHNDALFVECRLAATSELQIPADVEERAIHIIKGEISIDHIRYAHDRMLILKPGAVLIVKATTDTHFILLGGSALSEPRHLWWNFVASHKERIEQAKVDWQAGKFGKIPGDNKEFIPLPEL